MPKPTVPSLGHWRRYLMTEMSAWMAEHEDDPEKAAAEVLPRVRGEYLAAYPDRQAEAPRIFDGQ